MSRTAFMTDEEIAALIDARLRDGLPCTNTDIKKLTEASTDRVCEILRNTKATPHGEHPTPKAPVAAADMPAELRVLTEKLAREVARHCSRVLATERSTNASLLAWTKSESLTEIQMLRAELATARSAHQASVAAHQGAMAALSVSLEARAEGEHDAAALVHRVALLQVENQQMREALAAAQAEARLARADTLIATRRADAVDVVTRTIDELRAVASERADALKQVTRERDEMTARLTELLDARAASVSPRSAAQRPTRKPRKAPTL